MKTHSTSSFAEIFRLPPKPGVYLFKDSREAVIYVGKAANLQQRVASYFQSPSGQDQKTLALIAKVAGIETIGTDTEKEALILENNLIKQYHPRYNVKLRDDKNYPYLRFPVREEVSILSIVRRVKNDQALYFGPYPSMRSLRETMRWIQKIFPIRTSLDTPITPRLRQRSREEWGWRSLEEETDTAHYREAVKQVRMFLEGRGQDLIARLRRKMGPGRQKNLLEFFGSVERIKKATVEELIQAPGVSLPTPRRIYDFFTSQIESSPRSILSALQNGAENRREIRV